MNLNNTMYVTNDDGEVTVITLKSVTLTLDNIKTPEILIANSIFQVADEIIYFETHNNIENLDKLIDFGGTENGLYLREYSKELEFMQAKVIDAEFHSVPEAVAAIQVAVGTKLQLS